MEKVMFENIIVDTELIPVREAASKGNLPAMQKLARHIIEGDRTNVSPEMTRKLIESIIDHEDFGKEIEPLRDTLKLMADVTSESYRAGEIEYLEYVEGMQLALKELLKKTVEYPFDCWPIEEMKHCLDWLHNAEIELAEYLNSNGKE